MNFRLKGENIFLFGFFLSFFPLSSPKFFSTMTAENRAQALKTFRAWSRNREVISLEVTSVLSQIEEVGFLYTLLQKDIHNIESTYRKRNIASGKISEQG